MNLSFVVIYLLKGQQNVEWDLVKTKYANAHMHILLKMPNPLPYGCFTLEGGMEKRCLCVLR